MSRCRCDRDCVDELVLEAAALRLDCARLRLALAHAHRDLAEARDLLDAAQRDARGWHLVAAEQKATIERLVIAQQGSVN